MKALMAMMGMRASHSWCLAGLLCVSCELSPSKNHRYHTPLPADQSSATERPLADSSTNHSSADNQTKTVPTPESESPNPAAPVSARTNQTAVDVQAITRQLMDADREFARRCQEKGAAEAFFEFLDADAIWLPAGEMPIHGRDAVRVKLAARNLPGVLTWTPVAAQAATSGDLGYTWGNYELRGENVEGKGRASYGKYICIWKKREDGSWRVVLQSSSSSPAPLLRRK
jgi:ketosteroid isomerase-like protein